MNTVYLLLGSNIGDSKKQLDVARKLIAKKAGAIIRQSQLYQTAAWGNTDQPDFLNQVLIVCSDLTASELMNVALQIEQEMGRIRSGKNAPRIIDIDILYYNKAIIKTENLIVPHPAIQDRRFVLTPLNELSPSFVHPALRKSNHQMLTDCTDELNVKKI